MRLTKIINDATMKGMYNDLTECEMSVTSNVELHVLSIIQ